MNKALLDTDILSELFKGINPSVGRNAAAYRQAFGHLTLSAITVMEIVSGLQRMQSPRRIQKFVNNISGEEVLPFDKATGKLAGLRRNVRPKSLTDEGAESGRAGQSIVYDNDRKDPLYAGEFVHRSRTIGAPQLLKSPAPVGLHP